MAGDLKLEILFGRSIYVLTRANCERVLALLDADAELGELLSFLREDLRAALAMEAAGGRVVQDAEPEITEEMTINVQLSTLDAEGVASAPRCHACGGPGRRLPAEPGDTEALWVCDAPDCWRRGMPAARRFFETGIR